jgi:hypothetical protein
VQIFGIVLQFFDKQCGSHRRARVSVRIADGPGSRAAHEQGAEEPRAPPPAAGGFAVAFVAGA